MAHEQQMDYCQSVKQNHPQFFSNRFVVDIGSLDINGSNKHLFENCLYLGVDLSPGRNVGMATKGHELDFPDQRVDVIISTECFEHDQFYDLTLQNCIRMLKPGGAFIFSCATTGRAEHGTRRTTPEDAPFIQDAGDWGDYYKNLEEEDIRNVLDIDTIFDSYAFSVNPESHDLYFWGIKKGIFVESQNDAIQIHILRKIISEQQKCSDTMSAETAPLYEKIANLKQLLINRDAHIVNLNQIITDFISSTSWRLTKPLRSIASGAKKARLSLQKSKHE